MTPPRILALLLIVVALVVFIATNGSIWTWVIFGFGAIMFAFGGQQGAGARRRGGGGDSGDSDGWDGDSDSGSDGGGDGGGGDGGGGD